MDGVRPLQPRFAGPNRRHSHEDLTLIAAIGLGLIEGATRNAATIPTFIDTPVEPAFDRRFIITSFCVPYRRISKRRYHPGEERNPSFSGSMITLAIARNCWHCHFGVRHGDTCPSSVAFCHVAINTSHAENTFALLCEGNTTQLHDWFQRTGFIELHHCS